MRDRDRVQMTKPGTMMVNTPRITGIDGIDERGAPHARSAARAGAVHGHGPGSQHRGRHRRPGAGFADVEVPALRQRLRDQRAIVDYDQAWNDDS